MDLKLKPFDFAQAVARAGLRTDGQPIHGPARSTGLSGPSATTAPKAAEPGSFQASMAQALRSVSDAQNEAGDLQRELQLGNPEVGFEQTVLSMQKAQIGFQAALSVRNRLVQAYSDIMNMPV